MHEVKMQFGFAMFAPERQFILDIPFKVLLLFRKYQIILKVIVFYASKTGNECQETAAWLGKVVGTATYIIQLVLWSF